MKQASAYLDKLGLLVAPLVHGSQHAAAPQVASGVNVARQPFHTDEGLSLPSLAQTLMSLQQHSVISTFALQLAGISLAWYSDTGDCL